jgi:hypothetical protein
MFVKGSLIFALILATSSAALAATSGTPPPRHLTFESAENPLIYKGAEKALIYVDFVRKRVKSPNGQREVAGDVTYDVYLPKSGSAECERLHVRVYLYDFAKPAWNLQTESVADLAVSEDKPVSGMCHYSSGPQNELIDMRSFAGTADETTYTQFLKVGVSTDPKFYGQIFLHGNAAEARKMAPDSFGGDSGADPTLSSVFRASLFKVDENGAHVPGSVD